MKLTGFPLNPWCSNLLCFSRNSINSWMIHNFPSFFESPMLPSCTSTLCWPHHTFYLKYKCVCFEPSHLSIIKCTRIPTSVPIFAFFSLVTVEDLPVHSLVVSLPYQTAESAEVGTWSSTALSQPPGHSFSETLYCYLRVRPEVCSILSTPTPYVTLFFLYGFKL